MAERFEKADLTGARFTECTFDDARIHNSYFRRVKVSGAWLEQVDISGLVLGLTVNGVDVGPLVEAELTRRHPERAKLLVTDAASARDAWAVIERTWPPTIERARRLPEPLLHERVDEEWSFLETLRPLVFVVDAWISRVVLGAADPFHPIGVGHDELDAEVTLHPDADPGLDEVLAAREERMATARGVIDGLTDAELDRTCDQNPAPGYPTDTVHPVRRCVQAVITEEWEHHGFARRDLAVLEARSTG